MAQVEIHSAGNAEWAVLTIDRNKVGRSSPLRQHRSAAPTKVDNIVFFVRTEDLPSDDPPRKLPEVLTKYFLTFLSTLHHINRPYQELEIPVVEYSIVSGRLEPRSVRVDDLKKGGEIYSSHPSLKAVREDLLQFNYTLTKR